MKKEPWPELQRSRGGGVSKDTNFPTGAMKGVVEAMEEPEDGEWEGRQTHTCDIDLHLP